MRELLNIGELAKILKISTSKIRYYEKVGILKPAKIDDNGYRLYDFQQLDRLDTILLLRDLGVSLAELKLTLNNYNIEDYIEMLSKSLTTVDQQILDLKNKRKAIQVKQESAKRFKSYNYEFKIVDMPKRELVCLHIGAIFDYTIKETHEIFSYANMPFIDSYDITYHIYHGNKIHSMYKDYDNKEYEEFLPKLELPAGKYVSHGIYIGKDNRVSDEVKRLEEYLKENNIETVGDLIVKENYRYSYYYANKFFVTIQQKIKE